jgi:hypothetical protein
MVVGTCQNSMEDGSGEVAELGDVGQLGRCQEVIHIHFHMVEEEWCFHWCLGEIGLWDIRQHDILQGMGFEGWGGDVCRDTVSDCLCGCTEVAWGVSPSHL